MSDVGARVKGGTAYGVRDYNTVYGRSVEDARGGVGVERSVVEVGASDSMTPEKVAECQRPCFPDLFLPR